MNRWVELFGSSGKTDAKSKWSQRHLSLDLYDVCCCSLQMWCLLLGSNYYAESDVFSRIGVWRVESDLLKNVILVLVGQGTSLFQNSHNSFFSTLQKGSTPKKLCVHINSVYFWESKDCLICPLYDSIHFHWDHTWQFQNSVSVRGLLSVPYNMTPEPAEERNLLGRTGKLLSFGFWSFAIPLSLPTTTTQPTARLHPGVASFRFRCDHSKLSLQTSRKTAMIIGSECQQKPAAMRKKTPQQQWESENAKILWKSRSF